MWALPTGMVCGAMPKTGSTFANKCAKLAYGVHNVKALYTTHAPLSRAERFTGNMVGTTRAPGAWYCSLYLHTRNLQIPERDNYLRAYGGGSLAFRDFLYGATHPAEERTPENPGMLARYSGPRTLAESGWGLWSWMHVYHYATRASLQAPFDVRWLARTLADMEQGHEAIGALLGREFIPTNQPAINTRERYTRYNDNRPYPDWFDDEMLGWVRSADGWLMDLCSRDVFGPAADLLIEMRGER